MRHGPILCLSFLLLVPPSGQAFRRGGKRLFDSALAHLSTAAQGNESALEEARVALLKAQKLAVSETEKQEVETALRKVFRKQVAICSELDDLAVKVFDVWALEPGLQETWDRLLKQVLQKTQNFRFAAQNLERWLRNSSFDSARTKRWGDTLLMLRWKASEGKNGQDLEGFEWAFRKLNPQKPALQALGGDVAVLRQDFGLALARYQKGLAVLTLSQQRQYQLAQKMMDSRGDGRLTEADPDHHFKVLLDAPGAERKAEEIRLQLERSRQSIGERLGWLPDHAVMVRVLESQEYDRLLSPHIDGVTEKTGILLRLNQEETPESLAKIVSHEYAHFVILSWIKRRTLPLWLHEGIATFLETTEPSLGAFQRLLAARQAGAFPKASELRPFMLEDPARTRLLYDVAGLLVRKILDRSGQGSFLRWIQTVSSSAIVPADPDALLRKETGLSLDEHLSEIKNDLLFLIRERLKVAQMAGKKSPATPNELMLWVEGQDEALKPAELKPDSSDDLVFISEPPR